MIFTYNILIHLFGLLMRFAALFNHKAKLWVEGRKNWEKLLLENRKENEHWIWFHCSSNGEFEDCHELFFMVKKENPAKKIILTFFSPTGYESHGHTKICDLIMYMPLDTPSNAKRFMEILKPDVAFFSRSEFWYNFLDQIKETKTPAYLLSFSLTNQSKFLKWPGKILFKKSLGNFDYFFCQNELTIQLLKEHFQLDNAIITGNSRFDRIYQASLLPKEFPGIENFITDDFMVVAGSTLDKDEEYTLYAMEKLKGMNVKCILVPHEIDSPHIDALVAKSPEEVIRFANIAQVKPSHKILIIDFVGGLKFLYRYADIAIIGGGFDTIGIHNIIEPSVYGVNTAFGPNYRDYPEAIDLLKLGASNIHQNAEELYVQIKEQVENPKDETFKAKIKNYVLANTGASAKTLEVIRERKLGLV